MCRLNWPMPAVNVSILLFVIVVMLALSETVRDELPSDVDAAIRLLYADHARTLRRYVERFCPDQASADDIVQETFIRAWRHLPQLSSVDFPVRPWLFRVYYGGRTLAKVARRLGIPDGTARSRLHYALEALRRQLEDREAIEPR